MIGAEELLCSIALVEFVNIIDVFHEDTVVVLVELLATVSTDVEIIRDSSDGVLWADHGATRPAMSTHVERVLMALSLICAFEPIGTVKTNVSFLGLMHSATNQLRHPSIIATRSHRQHT
jgi:hypothetical protein